MADVFDYDVFLSFASDDEELARPIWQDLSVSGLRVFWSDVSLKNTLGSSWVDVIEQSLQRSRHLLLLITPAAMASKWVKREYTAFHNHCYRPDTRRLIPLIAPNYRASDLPLFLRELQADRLSDPGSVKRVIQMLGGADVTDLRRQVEALRSENSTLRNQLTQLKARPEQLSTPEQLTKEGKDSTKSASAADTEAPAKSEYGHGVPTETELAAVMEALLPDHVAALKTLYGVGPGDPEYRDAVHHAMTIGMIRRAEFGGTWGKTDTVQKIKWADADESAKRLKRLIVTDLAGGTTEVTDPVIVRHMASDRVAMDLAHGDGTIKLDWWRVRELTILGDVLGKVPGYYSFDILDAEVLLTDDTAQRVGVVDGFVKGTVPLGQYSVSIAKLRKLIPITSLHEQKAPRNRERV
jgi:hypothetical protein